MPCQAAENGPHVYYRPKVTVWLDFGASIRSDLRLDMAHRVCRMGALSALLVAVGGILILPRPALAHSGGYFDALALVVMVLIAAVLGGIAPSLALVLIRPRSSTWRTIGLLLGVLDLAVAAGGLWLVVILEADALFNMLAGAGLILVAVLGLVLVRWGGGKTQVIPEGLRR